MTEYAAGDPVLAALPRTFRPFQWHSDTFSLPPGAHHLAASSVAPVQAFRHGRATYGIQFHFEASRAVVKHWKRAKETWIAQRYPEFLQNHLALESAHGHEADSLGLSISRAWVGLI